MTDADLAGESIYNDDLAAVVAELEGKKRRSGLFGRGGS